MDIKKPGNVFPKMFKTFSLFLIVALCSFFGCIQFFKPTLPGLIDSNPTDAQESTPFQEFVAAMMSFENIDTNFKLGIDNQDLSLFAEGNVVYDTNGKMALDVDFVYDQQSFNLDVKYLSPYMYLTLTPENPVEEVATFKFDTTSEGAETELDFAEILNFVSKVINFDMDKMLKDFLNSLGIDLENFDLNSIIRKQEAREGGYEFVIGLGNISAQILCDESYNIQRIVLRDAVVNGTALTFNANVNLMNNDLINVFYNETGDEVDLTGLTTYSGYLQNLLKNDYVVGDVDLKVQDKTYHGILQVDTTAGVKTKVNTIVEDVEIELIYADEVIFLDVSGLKLKLKVQDFAKWQTKLEELIEKHTNKTVADVVKEIVSKLTGNNFEAADLQDGLLCLLAGGFSGVDDLLSYLPVQSILNETDGSFQLVWDSALKVKMTQENNQLKTFTANSENFALSVVFALSETGFDIYDKHFDLTNLLPLADVIDEIIIAKQFGGKIEFEINGQNVNGNYVVDFENAVKAEIEMRLFGEKIKLVLNENQILLVMGEVVIEGSLEDLNTYLQKVEEIFEVELTNKNQNITTEQIVKKLCSILKQLSIVETEDKLAVVSYISTIGSISMLGNNAVIEIESGELKGKIFVAASNYEIVVPSATDDFEMLLRKLENLKNYIESKTFAFDFDLTFEKINLSGTVQLDLNKNIFVVSGILIGNNILNVRYENSVVYVEYAENKFKIAVENVTQIYEIIQKIIDVNLNDGSGNNQETINEQLSEMLIKIFGEDVSKLSVEAALKKLSVKLSGNLNNLDLNLMFNTVKVVGAQIALTFVEDKLNALKLNINEVANLNLVVSDFSLVGMTQHEKAEYYDLMSVQKGCLTVVFAYDEKQSDGSVQQKQLEIYADVEIDLSDKMYVKLSTSLFGENVELIVFNDKIYVSVGGLNFAADLSEAKELWYLIVEIFDIQLDSTSKNFDLLKMLENFDLNTLLSQHFENVDLSISSDCFDADVILNEKVNLKLGLVDEQVLTTVQVPENFEDIKVLLSEIKSVMKMFKKAIFEGEINLYYNGLDFSGVLKVGNGIVEISNMLVCGELFNIRLQDEMLYLSYGNMKIKASLSGNGHSTDVKEILNKLTSDELGVQLQFGVFEELLNMFQTYTLEDWMTKILLEISGNASEISLKVSNKKVLTISDIVTATLKFVENDLNEINLSVYGLLNASVKVLTVENSTIKPFNPEDYADYAEDYIDGMMNSLKVEENVYALSSDIAIRYSNNTFYGQLTAMLVDKPDHLGVFGTYMPAISLYTTSLGLKSYIYLIGETIYIDINGLQVSADLNKNTINEILNFIQEKFGLVLGKENQNNADALKATAEAFKVIIPALDKVYGSWVQLATGNFTYQGVQINIDDCLWYSEVSNFSDILIQLFIQNFENTVVPTKIVLGANINDPNTVVYDDYSDFLLTEEDPVTSKLNFAVYLTNLSVGRYVENLSKVFISESDGYRDITAVKSNYSTSLLSQFSPYTTLLELVGIAYDYAMGFNYQINLSASIQDSSPASNVLTKLDGNVRIALGDLQEGEANESGFILFGNKFLQVYADGIDIRQQGSKYANGISTKVDSRQLIDLRYRSTSDDPAIYLTYTHSNYADDVDGKDSYGNNNIESGNKFQAKINNSNLSEIISMALAFANVNLGEEMIKGLGLPENKTDFSFVQSLLGIEKHDVSDNITQVDKILTSVTNITKMLKEIQMTENGFVMKIDLEGNEKISIVSIKFETEAGVKKLKTISVENLVMGEQVFNLTLNFNDFNHGAFSYFDKNPLQDENGKETHINFSEVSSFVDVAVNTINTKGFNYSGEMILSLIGIDAIKSYIDLEIKLSDNGNVSAHVEIKTDAFLGATWGGINQKFTTWETFNKRVAVLDFANNQLKLVQKTYQSRNRIKTLFDKTYTGDEILNNIVEIFAECLGLTNLAYDVMKKQIASIDPHPTLERAILGYDKSKQNNQDAYVLTLAGENVTGMSGFKDFDLNFISSENYTKNSTDGEKRQVRFLQKISTFINIADAVKINLSLDSNSSADSYVNSTNQTDYRFMTNEYYRKQYLNKVA